jgi:hypothetical protein
MIVPGLNGSTEDRFLTDVASIRMTIVRSCPLMANTMAATVDHS